MSLLDRIALSNGDPQRTITALRLVNKRLENEAQAFKCILANAGYGQDTKLKSNAHRKRRLERSLTAGSTRSAR